VAAEHAPLRAWLALARSAAVEDDLAFRRAGLAVRRREQRFPGSKTEPLCR
jgi:hypothetical protein